jgi:hypothetical protein
MVTLGVHEPPENDLEQFLSMIRLTPGKKRMIYQIFS